MAQPSRTTVTIDGKSFNAITTNFGISTEHDGSGMPLMGSISCAIDVHVDVNDNVNIPFSTLRSLFDLANVVTRDKLKNIKIEFWIDDSRTDVVCSYSFQGWISRFNISNSGEANHVLSLSLEPALMKDQKHKIEMSN
jgi:hypothetical protein